MGEAKSDERVTASAEEAANELARAVGLKPPFTDGISATAPAVFAGFVLLTFCLSIAYRVIGSDPAGFAIDGSLFTKWFIWLDVLNGVLIGYAWAAVVLMRRWVMLDLVALRPSLTLDDGAFHEKVRRIAGGSAASMLVAGATGGLALFSMAIFDPGFWTGARPDFLSLEMFFYGGRQFAIGMLAGVAILREVRATRGISQLGAHHTRVDLLDLRPLYPFAHKGLRGAATWLVSSSLISLFWLSEAVAVSIGPIVLVVIVLAAWVFLYPLVPLHNAIVKEKDTQLDRVRDAIRDESDSLEVISEATDPRFANLVAYYNLIEGAREWPIETPTLLRLAAFVTLGLGSWLGGAFVERLVESVVQ